MMINGEFVDFDAMKKERQTLRRMVDDRDSIIEGQRDELNKLRAQRDELVGTLESIAHGTIFDDCGNRDDDGIDTALMFNNTATPKQLRIWFTAANTILNKIKES